MMGLFRREWGAILFVVTVLVGAVVVAISFAVGASHGSASPTLPPCPSYTPWQATPLGATPTPTPTALAFGNCPTAPTAPPPSVSPTPTPSPTSAASASASASASAKASASASPTPTPTS